MKNTLLTTTALAMTTGMAFAEGAVDFKIGGFYRVTAAVSSIDIGTAPTAATGGATAGGDYDGFDTLTNAEIHFKPSITLDNGIKIGAIIELEGDAGSGDRIDHDTIYAQGDFGRLEIGSRDSAGKRMQIGAPDVSMVYANSTSLSAFVPFAAVTTFIDTGNDAQRTTYFSPTFGGFKFGASYARDTGQGNGAVNNNAAAAGSETDIFDLGVSYYGTIGGVDLGVSARYGSAENNDPTFSPDIMGAGISLGFGAISFGGGYVEQDTSATTKSQAYDIGISYANGPMSYSLTYANGEPNDTTILENSLIVAAATYKVNSNFKVGAAISQVESEGLTAADNVEGTVFSLSAQFNF